MSQIFQSGQRHQLQVHRIHHQPSVHGQGTDNDPDEQDQNVVGKDQIVDDAKEDGGQYAKTGEGSECIQPWQDLFLIFLWWCSEWREKISIIQYSGGIRMPTTT